LSEFYLPFIILGVFMKKLQLLALFFAASATDVFAGKTVRNSAEEPNARKQYLTADRTQPTQREINNARTRSERAALVVAQQNGPQKSFEDKK